MKNPNLQITQNLHESLKQLFKNYPHVPVTKSYESVEAFLLTSVRDFVLNEISLIAEERKLEFYKQSAKRFLFDDKLCEIRLTEDSEDPRTLILNIRAIDPKKSKLSSNTKRLRFESPGKFNEIYVRTETDLRHYQARLAMLTKEVLETGYRWLLEFVSERINEINDEIADHCYSLIRKLFNEITANSILLWRIYDNKGMYIVDPLVFRLVTKRATTGLATSNVTPFETIIDFTTTSLGIEKSVSIEAVRQDRPIVQDLSEAIYRETGYNLSENMVYNDGIIVAQPLVTEGQILLVAGYPAKFLDLIKPILEKERENFKQILLKSNTKIVDLHEAITENTFLNETALSELPPKGLIKLIDDTNLEINLGILKFNAKPLLEWMLSFYYKKK